MWIDEVYDPTFVDLPTVGEELEYIIENKESGPKSPIRESPQQLSLRSCLCRLRRSRGADRVVSSAVCPLTNAVATAVMCNKPGNDASFRVDDLAKRIPPPGGLVSLAMGSPETFTEAEREVVTQSKKGGWLMLKNVHLAPEWCAHLPLPRVLPLPPRLRHSLCLAILLPSRLRHRLGLVIPLPTRLRHRLCLAFPLSTRLRHCLCLVCSTAYVAETPPFALRFHCLRG